MGRRAGAMEKNAAAQATAKSRLFSAFVEAKARTKEMVSDRTFQVTAASATGGALACGMGGAAMGVVGGGFVGAAVGLVPALFTFGLSIPVFFVVGGGMGATVGATAGGTVGSVGGGATGYGVYTRRDKIVSLANLM